VAAFFAYARYLLNVLDCNAERQIFRRKAKCLERLALWNDESGLFIIGGPILDKCLVRIKNWLANFVLLLLETNLHNQPSLQECRRRTIYMDVVSKNTEERKRHVSGTNQGQRGHGDSNEPKHSYITWRQLWIYRRKLLPCRPNVVACVDAVSKPNNETQMNWNRVRPNLCKHRIRIRLSKCHYNDRQQDQWQQIYSFTTY